MFLKRVTLQGFKSFADRTELTFGDGITAIVGPNGCGKSNVLDAVRWVLGEQSAKSLRGSRMLDVVFSGSRTRKPANAAEVELHFDNTRRILASDQEEVTVGRVLYRNGDSEYRLNGETCRLKDVRDLFLDTGVGVDAYSVIEQGKVDRLLQASPLERREIFEEAAGISRYKVRRTEAQRRLERTQQNLLRLTDVVDELERQLRSVKLAAAKANKFQEYDSRLRELRSAFALAEFHGLEHSRSESESQRDTTQTELSQAREELAATDARAAEREQTLRRLEDSLQEAETRLRTLEGEIGTLNERASQGDARVAELTSMRDRRAEQATELVQRAALLQAQIDETARDLQSIVALIEEKSNHVDGLQTGRFEAEAQCDAVRRSVATEKDAAFAIARRAALIQNQITNCEQHQARHAAWLQRLDDRRKQAESELCDLESHSTRARERAAELLEAIGGLDMRERDCATAISTLSADLRAAAAAVGEQRVHRSALLSRQQILQDLERRRDEIGAGTRAVLAWREDSGADGSVLGLVADLLKIDDPRIAVLQHLLAQFEQAVVVRSADAFFAELDRRGGLTAAVDIIALDQLTIAGEVSDYGTVAGGVVRATEWVRCEPELRPLAERLLGRVFLVETRASALKRAQHAPAGCVFVTPAGEVAYSGGRTQLGPLAAESGLITRQAELLRVEESLQQVEADLAAAQRREAELDAAAADLELQRESIAAERGRALGEQSALRAELARVEIEQARLGRAREDLARETSEAASAGGELQTQLTILNEERRDVASLEKSHGARVRELETELNSREQNVARHSQQLTDALVEIGRHAEKRAAAEQSLRELRGRVAALDDERKTAEREACEAGERIGQVRHEISEARRTSAEKLVACGTMQAHIADAREQRRQLRNEIESCSAQLRGLHHRIESLSDRMHGQETALREIAVRKENIVVRIREELNLEVEQLYAEYLHREQDWDLIRAEIEELRGKIQRLGNVNLDAIRELEELQPRHANLVQQRADLTDSIQRLSELITQLDAESQKRFAEAFEEIRANFQELFRKLFGGGRADVILEDPDKPLECGLEVIARPPGKEPQSISLLSGGEKTMTCVALLMAVFKSKPSPFAILDEVDAALDEANVERFSNLLQEFLSMSQFVVITHNKKTMAAADVLYGVTMEEPGVSKRVSVRFDDRVHTPVVA